MHNDSRRNFLFLVGGFAAPFRFLNGQPQSNDPLFLNRVATVVAIGGGTIYANEGKRGPLTLIADADLVVTRGPDRSTDLSLLKPGDLIMVKCRADSAGKLYATQISVNAVAFYAVVLSLGQHKAVVAVQSKQGALTSEQKTLMLSPATLYNKGRGSQRDLVNGRALFVTGADMSGGVVNVARIVAYEKDGMRPLHMEAGAVVISPTPIK